jgi:hypothetical protein
MASKNQPKVTKRNDTAIRLSRWLDDEVEKYLKDKKIRLEFPSKRNFVDSAVLRFLEERGVKI